MVRVEEIGVHCTWAGWREKVMDDASGRRAREERARERWTRQFESELSTEPLQQRVASTAVVHKQKAAPHQWRENKHPFSLAFTTRDAPSQSRVGRSVLIDAAVQSSCNAACSFFFVLHMTLQNVAKACVEC